MRQLKFRAWDKEAEIMSYFGSFFLIENMDSCGLIFHPKVADDHNGGTAKDFELMQFTGLKDKNEKEIYEGDIVKFGSLDDIGIIKFFESRFIIEDQRFYYEKKLYVYNKKDPDTFIEVIGNIYENPKLSEEKK